MTRTVTVERDLPFPQARVWRALTTPTLMAEWLMTTDFAPEAGRRFTFTNDWLTVNCEVVEIDPMTTLAYRWDALDLRSVVRWTLTPTATGTHLRMEQTGFGAHQGRELGGARAGWTKFLDQLQALLDQPGQPHASEFTP